MARNYKKKNSSNPHLLRFTSKQKKLLKKKRILITGGTGSFGSTMMRALLSLSPKEIVIFSRDELKQYEMRNAYDSDLLRFVIGDIRDQETLSKVMRGVDYVFHAAALKQVPTCEFFPMEAVKTNIVGGYNVMNAAIENNVERVVVLSTDKAVYPINAMGMSKALMEKTMMATAKQIEKNGSKTTLCGVRYGNVMYSRGSVIPVFVNQIKKGEKLSITDPRMTRFLLPLRDSVSLVLHALSRGHNGSLYVRKAPAADMETLARAVSELFGYNKGYKTIGIRAGEKIHETLISREEWMRVKDEGDFYRIPEETSGLDYDKYFFQGDKGSGSREGYTSENTKRLTLEETKKLLLTLPEIKEELNQ